MTALITWGSNVSIMLGAVGGSAGGWPFAELVAEVLVEPSCAKATFLSHDKGDNNFDIDSVEVATGSDGAGRSSGKTGGEEVGSSGSLLTASADDEATNSVFSSGLVSLIMSAVFSVSIGTEAEDGEFITLVVASLEVAVPKIF